MKFEPIKVFREKRFGIGKELQTEKYFIFFPVFNGMVEYSEYYQISDEEFNKFFANYDLLVIFVNECISHKHDNRLMEKLGTIRGYAPLIDT